MSEPNMAVMTPSRKKPRPGDTFAIHLPSVGYVFGRVIFVDLPQGPMGPGANLIYIYDQVEVAITDVDRSRLRSTDLLLAPIFTNRLPWSRGYFQTIESVALSEDDVLDGHCFRDPLRSRCIDLAGREVPESQPCGYWGLDSYRTIDDAISEALGIPRTPDDARNA